MILLGAIWDRRDLGRCFCLKPIESDAGTGNDKNMADDSRFRFPRPGESSRRAAAEPARESKYPNDPLAELARLIGKNDPYAQFGLNTTPRSDAPEEHYSRDERYSPQERYADEGYSAPARPEYDEERPRYETAYEDGQQSYGESYDEPQDEPYRNRRSQSYQQPYQDPYQSPHGARGLQGYDTSREHYRSQEDFAPADSAPTHPEPGHDPRLHQWHYEHQAAESAPPDDEAHAEYAHARSHYEADGRYGHDEDAHESGRYADEEASLDPSLEQVYDDPPQAHRRGGLATALALIGCAMLGTAGAYAYRSFHGPQVIAGPPPVIVADNATPTKIVPAQAGNAQAGKSIQDRIADAGREQVVSKQEEPVAEKDLGTQAVPRVVLPAPVAPMPVAPQRPRWPPSKLHRQFQARRRPPSQGKCTPSPFVPMARRWRRRRPVPRAQLRRPRESPADRCRSIRKLRIRLLRRPPSRAWPLPRHRRRAAPPEVSWCSSPRRRARLKRRPLSAACRRNFPISSPSDHRSSGVRISEAKEFSIELWSGRLRARRKPASFARATRPPAASAWCRATEFPLTTAICAS